jgi:hypothetical protein
MIGGATEQIAEPERRERVSHEAFVRHKVASIGRRHQMKLTVFQFDLKSLVIGVLLAVGAWLLFAGTSSRAQSEPVRSISVGDGGVYLLKGEKVYWKARRDCDASYRCQP